MSSDFAVIFDMDGVLVDSEKYIAESHKLAMAKHGVDNFNSYLGLSLRDKIPIWEKELGIKIDTAEFRKEGGLQREKMLETERPSDALINFLEELKQNKVPLAVATLSYCNRTNSILSGLGLAKYFDVVVTGDAVVLHKPAPEIYLKASHLLGVESTSCVAFEDTPVGITAAKKAGMMVIGIQNAGHSKEELNDADLVVTDFSQVSYTVVKKLILAKK